MDLLAEEEAVVEANARFYQAFESLDIRQMESVWSTTSPVQCIHPGWGLLSGWGEIRDAWVRIFNNTSAMSFVPDILHVTMHGDHAWLVCVEEITSRQADEEHTSQVIATNVFERHDGRWLMVHHHGSPIFRTASGED